LLSNYFNMKLSNVALALFPASVVKVFAEDQAVIEWEALDESTGETTKDETVQAVEWAYSDATATKQVIDIGVLNVYEEPVTIYKGVRAEMVPPNTAQGVAVNSHGYSHVSSFQHSGSSFQSGSSFLYGKSGKASGQCLAKNAACSTADDRCCFGYACGATIGDYECKYCGISNERCLENDDCCEGYVCPYGNAGSDPKYCVAAAHGGSSKSGKSSQPPTYQTCDFDDNCGVGSVCAPSRPSRLVRAIVLGRTRRATEAMIVARASSATDLLAGPTMSVFLVTSEDVGSLMWNKWVLASDKEDGRRRMGSTSMSVD
jgi:hypothetical protein